MYVENVFKIEKQITENKFCVRVDKLLSVLSTVVFPQRTECTLKNKFSTEINPPFEIAE